MFFLKNLEPFSSPIFGKLLSSIAIPIWKKISESLVRPKIKLKKAPKNVFEYIKPTSSKGRVKDLLGAPHNVLESKWCYEFLDAAIQIDFNDDSGAKYIVLGLQGIKKNYHFSIPMFEKPLGKLTLADVLEEEGNLEYFQGLRSEELVFTTRIGPPGYWKQFHFGVLWPLYGASVYESGFEWDHEDNKLKTPPENILINWVGISQGSDDVCFEWQF